MKCDLCGLEYWQLCYHRQTDFLNQKTKINNILTSIFQTHHGFAEQVLTDTITVAEQLFEIEYYQAYLIELSQFPELSSEIELPASLTLQSTYEKIFITKNFTPEFRLNKILTQLVKQNLGMP